MSASAVEEGATLILSPCDAVETQLFSLQESGNLVTKANPDLCVTANSTQKREGRGGSPVHVMRPLSLQPCSSENKAYQTWSVFSL